MQTRYHDSVPLLNPSGGQDISRDPSIIDSKNRNNPYHHIRHPNNGKAKRYADRLPMPYHLVAGLISGCEPPASRNSPRRYIAVRVTDCFRNFREQLLFIYSIFYYFPIPHGRFPYYRFRDGMDTCSNCAFGSRNSAIHLNIGHRRGLPVPLLTCGSHLSSLMYSPQYVTTYHSTTVFG